MTGFGWKLTTLIKGEWEDMNQKSTGFAALQQDDEDEDNNGDEAMTEVTTEPKPSGNVFASTNVNATPAGPDPASVDEDDEIT